MVSLKSESYQGTKIWFEKGRDSVAASWPAGDGTWNSVFGSTKQEAFEEAKRVIDAGGR